MNLPFTNIRQVLSLHNKVSPEKTFLTVITQKGREELSYAEFSARSHQAANFLQEDLGIQPGDVVAILDDQSSDSAVLMMAIWLIGAVVVPLSAPPADVVAEQLRHSGAKVALIPDPYLADWQFYMRDEPPAELRQFWDRLTIIQLGGEPKAAYQHFHTLVRTMPNTFFNEHPEPTLDSPAALLLVAHEVPLKPLTQKALLESAQILAHAQTITGNQRSISYLPLAGQIRPCISALDAITIGLGTLLAGSSLIISSTFESCAFWHEVAASRLHVACLDSDDLIQLIAYAHQQQADGKPIYGEGVYQQDIKQLRHIYCPDAANSPELIHQFTTLFPFPVLTNS